jgi:hypothetical protein
LTVISCTKKLFELSHFPERPVPEVGYNPLYSWHAHIFRTDRKNCILMMNDLSRYQLVWYGVKKEHYVNFDSLFPELIQTNFRAENIDESLIDRYMTGLGQLIFTKTHNRSVLASINDHIYFIDRLCDKLPIPGDINFVELSMELNRMPMVKLKTYPIELLKKCLGDM